MNLSENTDDTLLAVFAISEDGIRMDISGNTDKYSTIRWRPEEGRWQVFSAVMQNTGQMVKRAAPGGEGLTVDPFSREALEVYLDRFNDAFGSYNPAIRAIFNDSYEVYAASFTPAFFKEFIKRRGYDLRPYIRELAEQEGTDTNIRIQSDYRETISDLLIEEFTIPWHNWITGNKSLSRLQAHGSPGNLLDLYGASSIPEGEIFGSTVFPVKGFRKYTADKRNPPPDPVMLKFASSAASTTGKNLASSETFTWAGEHFNVTLAELKPELEQVFLAGVNHMFFHGTSYSPKEAAWPGWLFYASVQFNPSNSFWPHLRGMNEYITRCQSVLQSGKPDNELLVYWPVHDIWHRTGRPDMLLTVHNIKEWLQPSSFYRIVSNLSDVGFPVDFISGRQLKNTITHETGIYTHPEAMPYKAIVIPEVSYIPVEDLLNIIRLAREGATVIFAALPEDVAGFHRLRENRVLLQKELNNLPLSLAGERIMEAVTGKGVVMVAEDIDKALRLKGIERETITDSGLKFIRRDHGKGKYYFVVNHTPDDVDTTLELNTRAGSVVFMDPLDGAFGLVAHSLTGDGKTKIRLQLDSGSSVIIKTSERKTEKYPDNIHNYLMKGDALTLDGEWRLVFTSGGPLLPEPAVLEQPLPWTRLKGADYMHFSGSAEYSAEFNLSEITADDYLLCLGEVMESARVRINGHDAGIVWSNPFRLKVGKYLVEGNNTLTVEVANLMANRIRYMDREGIPWKLFHDINFVSINYSRFDASDWPVLDSGLKGPVRLIPLNTDINRGLL